MAIEIKDALLKLNVDNDNHWTDDGLPRMETIKFLMGGASITRDEINKAFPNFSRETAKKGFSNTETTPAQPIAKVEKVDQVPSHDDLKSAEAALHAAIANLEAAKATFKAAQALYDSFVVEEEAKPPVSHAVQLQAYFARQAELRDKKANLAAELRKSGFTAETLKTLIPGTSELDKALKAARRT